MPKRKSSTEEALCVGIHAVGAALENQPNRVRLLQVAAGSGNRRAWNLADQARTLGIEVQTVEREVLDARAGATRHQDVLAELVDASVLGERDIPRLLENIEGDPLVLVLDGIQDPHNLGACIRTADAAGAHFVIVTRDRSAGLTPTARRSAAGAAEALPVVVVTNLARVLRELKQSGVWLAGLDEEGDTTLWQTDLSGPLALVLGAEGGGLRRLTREHCDYLVRIPMGGSVESLNVSVATGVCLFDIVRRRHGA